MPSFRSLATIALTSAGLAACGTPPTLMQPPDVPASLKPPVGQVPYVQAFATGVQVYECSRKTDATYQWAFKAPEASLATRSGQALGKHFAGPTWEATDGSSVVGAVKATDPGPTPSAIPWLLLSAKSNTGSGLFAETKSVQRLSTVGGVAPAQPCAEANVAQIARVPYTATYYFYR
jgi:hypothetical protein